MLVAPVHDTVIKIRIVFYGTVPVGEYGRSPEIVISGIGCAADGKRRRGPNLIQVVVGLEVILDRYARIPRSIGQTQRQFSILQDLFRTAFKPREFVCRNTSGKTYDEILIRVAPETRKSIFTLALVSSEGISTLRAEKRFPLSSARSASKQAPPSKSRTAP